MTKLLIDNYSDKYNFIVTFANTGLEHEKTLEFIHNCDKYFNFNTVWLEADVDIRKGKGTKHKIVSFETASRKGEPYEAMIKKYGIPNVAFPFCTRELKLAPMRSYLKSLGIQHNKIPTAIGIRTDEVRRVSKQASQMNIVYPLIDDFPSDKEDVNIFWENQQFNLGLDAHNGNCKGCFKKSFNKLFKQLDEDLSVLDFHIRMEDLYGQIGANQKGKPDRVFFRGNRSASDVIELHLKTEIAESYPAHSCEESCEVYFE